MMKSTMWGTIFLATALIQAGTVPELVNYQGRLTDQQGDVLQTADYALRFEVWSDPVAGVLVWGPLYFDLEPGGTPSDGHKFKVPIVQGYFNVVLDRDTASRSIVEAFPEGTQYVEVAVWDDGTTTWRSILPRQQVLSAPYAVSADRSREVVSGVGEATRIACQTSPGSTQDVIVADDTGAAFPLGVSGDLDVSGAVQCDNLTALNDVSAVNLSLSGDLSVAGSVLGARSVELLSRADDLPGVPTSGSYNGIIRQGVAAEDGLLVGNIHCWAQNVAASIWADATIGSCPGSIGENMPDNAVGASVTTVAGQDNYTRVNSFFLPVRKGENWCVWYFQEAVTNQGDNVYLEVFWWPLGKP